MIRRLGVITKRGQYFTFRGKLLTIWSRSRPNNSKLLILAGFVMKLRSDTGLTPQIWICDWG